MCVLLFQDYQGPREFLTMYFEKRSLAMQNKILDLEIEKRKKQKEKRYLIDQLRAADVLRSFSFVFYHKAMSEAMARPAVTKLAQLLKIPPNTQPAGPARSSSLPPFQPTATTIICEWTNNIRSSCLNRIIIASPCLESLHQ